MGAITPHAAWCVTNELCFTWGQVWGFCWDFEACLPSCLIPRRPPLLPHLSSTLLIPAIQIKYLYRGREIITASSWKSCRPVPHQQPRILFFFYSSFSAILNSVCFPLRAGSHTGRLKIKTLRVCFGYKQKRPSRNCGSSRLSEPGSPWSAMARGCDIRW